jgi:dihydrodipicolinate synthase/N-acetylneuraminate lyase
VTLPESGIWGFPLTPFTSSGVDLDLLEAGAEHQVAGGVDVLCACGTIAQADQLSDRERLASLETVVAAAGGRVPVVATVPDGPEAPGRAAAAVERGAAALLVIPRSPDPATVRASLGAIARAAPQVPQILYHRPPLVLDVGDLPPLAATPELSWVKDGHRDVRRFRRLRAAVPRLRWVSAWEDVAIAFWALGCDAFAPASAAYAPQYAAAWLGRLRAGDVAGATALLEAHAYPLVDLRLARPGIDVPVVKAAMEACGVPAGLARAPAQALTGLERDAVRSLVDRMRAALSGQARPGAARGPRRAPPG